MKARAYTHLTIRRADGSIQREVEQKFFISLRFFDIARKLPFFRDILTTSTILYPTSSFCKKRLGNVRNIWQLRDSLIAFACGKFVFVCPGLSPFSMVASAALAIKGQIWQNSKSNIFFLSLRFFDIARNFPIFW